MDHHTQVVLDSTARALQPQPTAQPVKVTKHKIAHGKRIRMLQAAPLRQITHRDGTRHAFNERGERI
jgi:hypothetical protein